MPEAPDLQVVKEVLIRRIVGQCITQARVVRPTVLRSLASEDFATDIAGWSLEAIHRRGKYLLLSLSSGRMLAVNPMLTGAFQLGKTSERVYKRTYIVLTLAAGLDLQYINNRQLGRIYYVAPHQLDQVPGLEEQGPDVLNQAIIFEAFKARLRPYRGEINGILTRGLC
jgi:formamidopyrimidine-DNA glycosylase